VQVAVAPVAEGVTAATFAVAPPVFVRVSVTASTWPVFAVAGFPWMASVAASAEGACTARGMPAGEGATLVPVLASVAVIATPRV
jgi:hypothetical protein